MRESNYGKRPPMSKKDEEDAGRYDSRCSKKVDNMQELPDNSSLIYE